MALVPLALPPGVMANGTELQAAGRWRDASLVRWIDGTMRPVGGWEAWHSTTLTIAPRAALAWRDNSGDYRIAFAAHNKVVSVLASGTATDITPATLTAGSVDAGVNTGYGGGLYGAGTYGTPRVNTGTYGEATTWALDTWGQELIACSTSDGRIWRWDLNAANDLTAVSGAPTGCLSAMVTAERFLFALAPGGNGRKVQWSDREDNTTWTPAATNEAGDIELQTSGQIMCGLRVPQGALLLTDQDAHLAQYVGPPFVYGFNAVGANCGTISRKSAVAVDGRAFWMGPSAFYIFDGAAQQIPCEVADAVFGDINRNQQSKVWGVASSQFGEVWWFYPSNESTECDRYVSYSYRENHWSLGSLARTCGVDRGVFTNPIWAAADGTAYNHETGLISTDDVYAETGPIQGGNGDLVVSCNKFIPDERAQGDVQVRFRARLHPNDTETEVGPYTLANPTSIRLTGRQIVMRVEQVEPSDWRFGVQRLEMVERGRR